MEANVEDYSGIGRRARRDMIRRWKQEAPRESLKEWAKRALLGEAAFVWARRKNKKNAR